MLDEIEQILKKHDMTGLMIVGNETNVDWRLQVEASWSCAKSEPVPGKNMSAFRIKAKAEDFPNKEAQKKCVEATIGNFVSTIDVMDRIREQLVKILTIINKSVPFIGRSTRED